MLEFDLVQNDNGTYHVREDQIDTVGTFLYKVLPDTTSAFFTKIRIDGDDYTGISYITFLGRSAGSSIGHYFEFKSIGSNPILEVSFESFGGNAASFLSDGSVSIRFTEPESVDLSEYAKLTDIPAMIIDADNYVATEESITKLFNVLESGGSLVFKHKITTNDVYV